MAKIADFGLSKSHDQQVSTLVTNNVAGTPFYLDPVYKKEGKLKLNSDIYSFGVVLFEILCGRLAYDVSFNGMGLAAAARLAYQNGTFNKLIDPKIKEADENIFISNEGVNQVSLEKFSDIAYKCIAESQNDRPTIEDVIKELKEALYYQASDNLLHLMLRKGSKVLSDFRYVLFVFTQTSMSCVSPFLYYERNQLQSLSEVKPRKSLSLSLLQKRFLGSFMSSEVMEIYLLSINLPKSLSCTTFSRNELFFGSNVASEEELLPS
ncbi:hypothetical protein E3N88_14344 [Mikania micrantha]|uniref:Protein kinase domain-containing protein n=1 Tax=Mikania micrantha TaxID=192012 RepID=A0A5N6P170_9ASTR|nr:hypothetical protein E3N88_14344 [Mikania micrantha]